MLDLVCHIGWVIRCYRNLVGLGGGESQTEDGLIAAGVPPEAGAALGRPDGDLLTWFAEGVDALLQTATATAPDKPLTTIYGQHTPPLLMRLMTHEMAIHRWDSEQATGRRSSFDPALAADGVDELTEYWVQQPRHLRWPGYSFRWAEFGGSGETIHLHADDSDDGWLMTVTEDNTQARRGHDEQAEVVARSTLGDLYLFMWRRRTVDQLEVHGNKELLTRWRAAARTAGQQ